jgi:hypothetical protein
MSLITLDARYPRCSQHGLLRRTNRGDVIVSSAALSSVLGDKYLACVASLRYIWPTSGFDPRQVEQYLAAEPVE